MLDNSILNIFISLGESFNLELFLQRTTNIQLVFMLWLTQFLKEKRNNDD
jgi:hypothetical protein